MPSITPLAAIRWLPLVNAAGTTIPAFACVQAVGTSLDATGQLMVNVAQPNGDPSATYLFNGPCAIAAGAGGSGTLDFPAQAMWDTATPAVGDAWGPKSGQWSLSKSATPGFPVLGLVDAPTQRMMVGSPVAKSATIVKPAYDIAAISGSTPGSGTGEVYTFDGTTLSDSGSAITVFNISKQVAKAATFYECVYVGSYALIVNGGSVSGGISFKLTAAFSGGSASATVGTPWGSAPNDAGDTVTVNDLEGLWTRALSGAKGEALYDPVLGYVVTICDQETLKYRGVIEDTYFMDTSASVTVGTLLAMNSPPFGQSRSASTITAENVLGLGGVAGAVAIIDWNNSTDQWELTMESPTKQQVMCRERLDASNDLQYTTRTLLGWFDDTAESAFGTVPGWQVNTVTSVIGVAMDDGTLQQTTQQGVCIGPAIAPTDPTNIFTTVSVTAVVNLRYDATVYSGGSPTYTGSHAFQGQSQTFTAINPSYDATSSGTLEPYSAISSTAGWGTWYRTVLSDPLNNVTLSGAGVLQKYTQDNYVLELNPNSNGPFPAGSLTTTTATVVSTISYAGALSVQTQTLTVLAATALGASTTLFTTGPVSAYTTLSGGTGSTPTLAGKQTTFTAISPGAEGALTDWYTPSSQTVVTTVTWDGTNLKQTTVTAFVFNYTPTPSTTIIDTATVCGTSG